MLKGHVDTVLNKGLRDPGLDLHFVKAIIPVTLSLIYLIVLLLWG